MRDAGRPQITRRGFLRAAGAAGFAMAVAGCPALVRPRSRTRSVIMLGIDGMDPSLVRHLMEQGRLPNCRRLAEAGCFTPLGTTDPPQSPVAWSSVISGTNPGGHGIFDFVARDPVTRMPRFSTAQVGEPGMVLKVGSHSLRIGAPEARNLRRGPTFWVDLERHGVPCSILRMPANFPPTPCSARTLSGMGTPDIEGTYGLFTLYTDDPAWIEGEIPGGRIDRIVTDKGNGSAELRLRGPAIPGGAGDDQAAIPFRIRADRTARAAWIAIQGREWILREGEWTEWIGVRFAMPGLTPDVAGMVRMYLKQAGERLTLYATPVNIDPCDPALPLSTPPSLSRELARGIGPFYTQGIAEETRARSAGVFDDDEFRHQALMVHGDAVRLLEYELARFESGFFFGYLSALDTCSHLFWRAIDRQHPLFTPELAARHGDFLPSLYERMDGIIGQILQRADDRTIVMVVSDHGFGPFRRQFNLNTWLMDNGYTAPLPDASRGETTLFADVKWSATRAYGLGINGLYLNLRGREQDGVVLAGGEADALADELIRRLTAIRDPETGAPVVSRVCRAREIYSGPYVGDAPDLVVCYSPGYRASWDTVLGRYPLTHVLNNRDPWSGDHATDSRNVSGVLLANRRIAADDPHLEDIAPTILRLFGAPTNPRMTGRMLMTGEQEPSNIPREGEDV